MVKKAAVILGAGASHDCHMSVSPPRSDWALPLADDLFSNSSTQQGRHLWSEALRHYEGAVRIATVLSARKLQTQNTDKGFSLEDELQTLAQSSSPEDRRDYKHVPVYIHRVIAECARRFKIPNDPGAYFLLGRGLMTEAISGERHHVVYLSLNYDTLLEDALRHVRSNYVFESFSDYICRDDCLVVKLHGSLNWFSRLGQYDPGNGHDWDSHVESIQPLEHFKEDRLELLNDLPSGDMGAGKRGLVRNSSCYYPLITAPLALKTSEQFACLRAHLERAAQFLTDCDKFLFIGTSGKDNHLLNFIQASRGPERPRPTFFFVGKGEDLAPAVDRVCSRIQFFHPDAARTCADGFTGFLAHPTLFQEFLEL